MPLRVIGCMELDQFDFHKEPSMFEFVYGRLQIYVVFVH